jgi:hypothetical protein
VIIIADDDFVSLAEGKFNGKVTYGGYSNNNIKI